MNSADHDQQPTNTFSLWFEAHNGADALFDQMLDAVIVVDTTQDEFRVAAANATARANIALSNDRITGASLIDLERGALTPQQLNSVSATVMAGEVWTCHGLEVNWPTATGSEPRVIDLRVAPLDDAVVIVWRDVTELARERSSLAESELRYRTLADNATDIVYTIDMHGTITWISPSCEDQLGWSPDQVVGSSLRDLMHPDDLAAAIGQRMKIEQTGHTGGSTELRIRAADGGYRWMSLVGRMIFDDQGIPTGGVESMRDITDRKFSDIQLADAARRDPLTGLANRAYLVEEIRRALSSAQRSGSTVAVLLLDLDNFKTVNDSLGHAQGDRLLMAAAYRLLSLVRDGDLVARQGGDEFAVVMRDIESPVSAMTTAQRIVEAFRAPLAVGDYELVTTASIGVVVARHDTDPDTILVEADHALYVAKDDGRDRASLFDDSIRESVRHRLAAEESLRQAIADGHLDVWFHPGFHIVPGNGSTRLAVVEALVRWHHDDGTVSAAADFIEIAEETGLITQIGDWVLRVACAHARRWNHGDGPPVHVAVNLSTRQLLDPTLLGMVDRAVAEAGVEPGWLLFEFPESPTLRAHSVISDNLAGLVERGFRLVVDGFGAEYASLMDLRDLPISGLKLDHQLVRSLVTDSPTMALTSGLIDLAHRLGLVVVGAGVETVEESTALSVLGCVYQQGYLYSAVIPALEVDALRHPDG